jgi:hypothetical protein
MKSSSSKVEEELGRGVILEAIVTLDKERKNSEEGESKEIKKIRKYLQRISRLNRRRQKKINVPKSGYDLTVTKILKRDTWHKTSSKETRGKKLRLQTSLHYPTPEEQGSRHMHRR